MVEKSPVQSTTPRRMLSKGKGSHCAEGRFVRVNFGDGKGAEVTSGIYVEESGRSGGGDLRQLMKSVTGAIGRRSRFQAQNL
jgi:hypothetical protein